MKYPPIFFMLEQTIAYARNKVSSEDLEIYYLTKVLTFQKMREQSMIQNFFYEWKLTCTLVDIYPWMYMKMS